MQPQRTLNDQPDCREPSPAAIDAFIAKWHGTGLAERANFPFFLLELCDILDVPRPDPATGSGGSYRFERGVTRHELDGSTSARRIDLYCAGRFIMEAKQGVAPQPHSAMADMAQQRANVRHSPGWARNMLAAKGQAERYVRDLPASDPAPPFIIVCDVGFCLDLYADFSGTGRNYAQFPDRERFRLYLPDLHRPEARARLRQVWSNPKALDPALRRQAATRDIAKVLAKLAQALEGTPAARRHDAGHVATFLMRCIFCMFAQSVGLLPERSFTDLLQRCRGEPPGSFVGLIGDLWHKMDVGGFYAGLALNLRRFNGGLFRAGPHGGAEPLPVSAGELGLLIEAAGKDWANVEPAIFGTLLENALDPAARAQLGAQFTPRAFVERLVLPTVMELLRLEWDGAKAAAVQEADQGRATQAAKAVRAFHARLCTVRVLDPACGTGNFLYVTLELMKQLEGEVLDTLAALESGAGRLDMAGATVDPHQFLGLDLNPRAVPVAELVLWIGYLQWHFRTHGNVPPAEPILRDFRNIREQDALLAYERTELVRDRAGAPVTRWGGRTKLHPITGGPVPDETDRMAVARPVDARPAVWPEAEFIVSNPPFVAGKDMRAELGDGYAEALWAAYEKVPASADLALFFWWKAAQLAAAGKVRRFGFITSNSIRQVFCRKVLADAMAARKPLHLVFAIPDHPWAHGESTAAVRISLTVAEHGTGEGRLLTVISEDKAEVPTVELAKAEGVVNADLSIGFTPADALPLRANKQICGRGVSLHGAGFIVSPATAAALGLGKVEGLDKHIRLYLNGDDLVQYSRQLMVIDLFGLTETRARERFPTVFQHLLLRVKPERDAKARSSPDSATYARLWWLFGKTRPQLRKALTGLPRYIATMETGKHRPFGFQPAALLPDNALVCIASAEAWHLGVLSSRLHVAWSLAGGGKLGPSPRYNKTLCFDPFPFPAAAPAQQAAIGALAEELDAHRKARLAEHAQLTLTGLYNVLDAVRAGRPLTLAERGILDAGQVLMLRHLHDRLDAAVADAYGWPVDLPAAEVVSRVVALNKQRVAEEAAGQVRWLRPAFQVPQDTRRQAAQAAFDVAEPAGLPTWPARPPEQFVALRAALTRGGPARAADLAARFRGASDRKLSGMLKTLAALGQAHDTGSGIYTG